MSGKIGRTLLGKGSAACQAGACRSTLLELLAFGAAGRGHAGHQARGLDRLATVLADAQLAGVGASQRGIDLLKFGAQASQVGNVSLALGLGGGIIVGVFAASGQTRFVALAIVVQPGAQRVSQRAAAGPQARGEQDGWSIRR